MSAIQSNVLPVEERVRELAALSKEEQADRLKNLNELPFVEQVRIKRLLADYSSASEAAAP